MRIGSPGFFIDTNILAYAYDAGEVAKRERAIHVLEALGDADRAAISTQVLGELYCTLTRGSGPNLPREQVERTIQSFLQTWLVYEIGPVHIVEAMRGVREHQMSYYDALIWATARLNGIPFLLSEDGQDGRVIEGVHTFNPLSPEFDLSLLS